jgi:SnoaL-like protein
MAIEPSPEIHRVMLEAHAAYLVGDIDAAAERFSRSDASVLVGTDPGKIMRVRKDIIEALRADRDEFADAGRRYVHRTTEAWYDGDFGWALSLGTICHDDGSEVPLRTSTVLHRSDGSWRIVQTLVPVPHEPLEPGSPFLAALTGPGP